MATITQRAQDAIADTQYFTPEECLKYLENESNFNSVSKELIRAMESKYGNDPKKLAEELIKLIAALEKVTPYKSLKQNVKKWFFEDAIPKRDSAIKICFSLDMSAEKATEFLRKGCRISGFNFRDAKEVVYYYCLLNEKKYSHACDLIDKYNAISTQVVKFEPYQATQALRNVFSEANWELEQDFFNVLCQNKGNFIGYSKTTTEKYTLYRNSLCWHINDWHISNPSFEEDPIITQLLVQVEKQANDYPDINVICKDVVQGTVTLQDVWKKIKGTIRIKNIDISDFLRKVISTDQLLRETIWGIPYLWHTNKEPDFIQFKASGLQDGKYNILDNFPKSIYFSELERNPENNTVKSQTRKIIILLFFFDYIYGWLLNPNSKKNYNDFFKILTDLLDACGMPFIYYRDPFDWLILKSVRSFGVNDPEVEDPIEFFNDVLRLSFSNDIKPD